MYFTYSRLTDDGAQLINQIWKQQIGKSFYYIWQKTTKKNGNSSLSQTEQHTDHLIKADLHCCVVDNRTLKRWFSSFSIGNALHVAAIIGTPHTTLVSRVLLWLCSKSRTIKIRSQQKVYTKNECWCCCCTALLSKKDDRIISNWAESSGHMTSVNVLFRQIKLFRRFRLAFIFGLQTI